MENARREIVIPYSPHPKQLEVHQSGARFKVLNFGRRCGKSTLALQETLKKALHKKGRYWIVAPSYSQAKNIYWRGLINQIPRELIAKRYENELIIILINGSSIELKGALNEDTLRGSGIAGLVLDEYAFMKPTVWEEILEPMIADSQGWVIWISTPNGFNHFYDLAEQAQELEEWQYFHATSYDNPHLPSEELKRIEKKTDPDVFAQEYMAEFKKMRGLVFKNFSRDVHLFDPSKMPEVSVYGLGVDFGWENPTACIFVGIDYDNNWYVFDEIYQSHLTTEKLSNALRLKMANNNYTYKVGDSASKQEIMNLEAPPSNISLDPVKKTATSIQTGIRLLTEKFAIQEGSGKPKLFIGKNCKNLIWELETYHYPKDPADRNLPESPIDDNNHAIDALRYLALTIDRQKQQVKVHKPKFMLERKYGTL